MLLGLTFMTCQQLEPLLLSAILLKVGHFIYTKLVLKKTIKF